MTDVIGPGSLKLVTASSRSLHDALHDALRACAGDNDVRRLRDDAVLVYTDADPATIRDRLAPLLAEGESVLVVEFERWSGYGPGIDRRWLLRRGH